MSKKNPTASGEVRGRDTKLTVRMADAIIGALSAGNYILTTCKYVGIARSSFNMWREKGEIEVERVMALDYDAEELVYTSSIKLVTDGEETKQVTRSFAEHFANRPDPFTAADWIYVVFRFHVERAQAAAEIRALTTIQQAMTDQWQAAGWFLERTQPDKYGRRDRINLEGSEPGSAVEVKMVTVDDLDEKIKKVLRGKSD